MAVQGETGLPLYRRLWIYQAERIPLGRTSLLLAAFSAASLNVSALLSGRDLPGFGAYAVAFFVALIFFFQLRAADEVKDKTADARYRPERPIPRGLVGLGTIVGIAVGLTPLAALAAILFHGPLIVLVALVWMWMGLMAMEFFAPAWLAARPLLYLVSHMAIMPLIDLFLTGTEWLPAAGSPPSGLILFLVLSFLNGCVLEIGRKIRAPEEEREGVETYSGLWGLRPALRIWIAVLALSCLLLALVGFRTGYPVLTLLPGAAIFLWCARTALRAGRAPDARTQKRIEDAAGLWVFTCYGASGLLPAIVRGMT